MIEQLSLKNRLIKTVAALLYCCFWFISGSLIAQEDQVLHAETCENTSSPADYINIQGFAHGEKIQSGSVSETGIKLDHKITKTESPWFYTLSITQHNQSVEKFKVSPGDSLLLHVGPLNGLTGADDSVIDLVASLNGKVQINQIQPSQSLDLLWPANQMDWAGLQDRYYALLIFPQKSDDPSVFLYFKHAFITTDLTVNDKELLVAGLPVITFSLCPSSLAPGEKKVTEFLIFSGPKSMEALSSGPINIRALLFPELPGWMRGLCFGLLWLLNTIFFVIPNWGLAIIFLALVVRLMLYPLAKKAMKSQKRFVNAQKQMQPELSAIKKNFKGGEQSERILELYKKHKVSPFAGLKPLLIVLAQLPILIALYHVLGSVYELRDARFLWIDSLAEPDKLFYLGFNIPVLGSYFNLLPLLMAAFTMLSFKLSPAPAADKKDSVSQKIFMPFMALGFFILFYSFPSGMVLYWTMANVFHIIQHKMILMHRKTELV